MEFQKVICNLCLKKCENFKTIDLNTRNVLDILLLKIDYTVIQEPVMCKNCAESLMKCSNFKRTCLRTYDYIVPFVNKKDDVKLDLKNIYMNKDVTGTDVPEDQDVCGFCMGLIKKCSALSLSTEEGDVMSKIMIERCLPEIDLRIFKKFVVCASCRGSLENCFRFVTSCLIVEEKVKKYCETINSKGQIELNRLLQFTERDVMIGDKNGNLVNIIKAEEQFCEDRKNPDEIGADNGGDIVKLEQMNFNPSENAYENFETKRESFSEADDQKVNNKYYVTPKITLADEGGNNKLGSIKEELFCEDETKLKEDNFVEMKNQTFLFDDDIEIKTDDHDFNRFEDGVVPHPEVTTKLHRSPEWLMSDLEGDLSKSHIKYTLTNKHVRGSDLEKHLIVHEDPSKITMHKCDLCSFRTKFKAALKRHLLRKHEKPSEATIHKCDSCSYQTDHISVFRRHLLIHKEPADLTMYKCESCSFQTKYKDYLKKHLVCHKEFPEILMHKCNSCFYQTKHKRYLIKHLLLHKDPSEIIMHKCDACPYQTRHKEVLKIHLRNHKDPSEITMYKCDSCSYQAKYKSVLKRHLLQHEDPSVSPIYNCDSCSYQTKGKKHFEAHLLKHKESSEVTMYKCDTCSYQTKHRGNLGNHLLVHKDPSSVKMYKCDSCSYQVKDKRYLKIHVLKHKESSDGTMYKCDSCSYQSIFKGLLKKHLLLHEDPSNLTIYNCDSCSYRTKYKTDLNKHLLKHKESSEVTTYKHSRA